MAARFNTVAAFVRGAVGPTDYTPVTITDNKYPRLNTVSHELALAVMYESGIIHFADKPEGYQNLPENAKDYLKSVPATWDETRLLAWNPGELLVVARKKDGNWFVAGINGKNVIQSARFSIPEQLSKAKILTDGNSLNAIETKSVINSTFDFSITMQPYGGFVIFPDFE